MADHFRQFWQSGIPWTKWGGRALYVINDREPSEVFQSHSRSGEHAEDRMLRALTTRLHLYRNNQLRILVYQNASPCNVCSENYVRFIAEAKELHKINLDLTIAFVALYKVKRPSRFNIHNLTDSDHKQNLQGLVQLRDMGVKFRCFSPNDWCKLVDYLGNLTWNPQEYLKSIVFKDNVATAKDLTQLLGRNDNSPNLDESRSDERIFHEFWKGGLHGQPWRWRTYAVTLNGLDSRVFKGRSMRHAEALVVADLRNRLCHCKENTLQIKVFQNYSPCPACCTTYMKFLNEARDNHGIDVELEIVFSVFFHIRRPSCEQRRCSHLPSQSHHRETLDALRDLQRRHVVLRNFQYQDWRFLRQYLGMSGLSVEEYRNQLRAEEDMEMSRDLQLLLGN